MTTKRPNARAKSGEDPGAQESQDRFGFKSTLWSGDLGPAGSSDDQVRLEALGTLYAKYRPPLKAYLMRSFAWKFHVDEDWVDDCLGSFVEKKLLKPEFLRAADRERGRFRDFLKTSLYHFAIDIKSREDRVPIENGRDPLNSGFPSPADPDDTSGPDIVWARGVLVQALQAMKAECLKQKQEIVWTIFERRWLIPLLDGAKTESLKDTISFVQRTFGEVLSTDDVSNKQTTGHRKLKRHLDDVFSEYCPNAEAIEAERQHFIESLRGGVHRKSPPTSVWKPKI